MHLESHHRFSGTLCYEQTCAVAFLAIVSTSYCHLDVSGVYDPAQQEAPKHLLGVVVHGSCKENEKGVVPVQVYTFGAPRTGNHSFAHDYNRVCPETWHVINPNVRPCLFNVILYIITIYILSLLAYVFCLFKQYIIIAPVDSLQPPIPQLSRDIQKLQMCSIASMREAMQVNSQTLSSLVITGTNTKKQS